MPPRPPDTVLLGGAGRKFCPAMGAWERSRDFWQEHTAIFLGGVSFMNCLGIEDHLWVNADERIGVAIRAMGLVSRVNLASISSSKAS